MIGRVSVSDRKKINVVILAKDEEEGLKYVLSLIPNYVRETTVVDGGLKDSSGKVARIYGAEVVHGTGKGYDFRYFLERVKKTDRLKGIWVLIDGDGSYDPREIRKLVEPIEKGEAQVVIGYRKYWEENSIDILRFAGGKFYLF